MARVCGLVVEDVAYDWVGDVLLVLEDGVCGLVVEAMVYDLVEDVL